MISFLIVLVGVLVFLELYLCILADSREAGR